MRAMIIAVIGDNYKNIIGFRVIRIPDKHNFTVDDSEFQIMDVKLMQVYGAMLSHKIDILNLEIDGKALKGANGSLDRYSLIKSNGYVSNEALVILASYTLNDATVGFMVCDHTGKRKNIQTRDLISMADGVNIANGKIVEYSDREAIISAIRGSYLTIEIESKKQEVQVPKLKSFEDGFLTLQEYRNYIFDYIKRLSVTPVERSIIMREINPLFREDYSNNQAVLYASGVYRNVSKYYIPEGVSCISESLSKNEIIHKQFRTELKILGIPSTCCINDSFGPFIIGTPSLERIIFNEGTRIIAMAGIKSPQHNIVLSIPQSVYKVTGVFMPNINETIDMTYDLDQYTGLVEIDKCFLGIERIDGISINNLVEISGSFCFIESINCVVALSSKLRLIRYSFESIKNLKGIDFTLCKELLGIKDSFNKISWTPELDLRQAQKLEDIIGSFNEVQGLTVVCIPDKVSYIGSSFNSSNIKEIHTGSNFRSTAVSFDQNAEIELHFEKSINLENISIVSNNATIFMPISDRIKMIDFGSSDINTIIFSDNTLHIEEAKFNRAKINSVIFGSNLKSIGSKVFCGLNISALIFPDSLQSLGNQALADMPNLRYVYLPSSLTSIGRSCLTKSGVYNSDGITVYTIKGSIADKYCKRNNINVCYVTSRDEAEQIINDNLGSSIGVKSKTKLSMLFQGDKKHSELLDDRYIGQAMYLYKLYQACTTPIEYDDITLNRKGYTEEYEETLTKLVELSSSRAPIKQNMTELIFINLCNLITAVAENQCWLLDKMLQAVTANVRDVVLYEKAVCDIGEIYHFSYKTEMLGAYAIYVIHITENGEQISYATICENESIINRVSNLSRIGRKSLPIEQIALERGNVFKIDTFPYYITTEVEKGISNQLLVLKDTEDIKKNIYTLMRTGFNVYSGNLVSLIKTRKRESYINADLYLQFNSAKRLNELTDEELKETRRLLYSDINYRRMKLHCLGDEYVKQMMGNAVYEDVQPCLEWEASKALHSVGIQKIEDIGHISVDILCTTSFVKRLSKAVKITDCYSSLKSEDITLNDGTSISVRTLYKARKADIIFDKAEYVYTIKNGDSIDYYMSSLRFSELFDRIVKIYNPDCVNDTEIVDDIICDKDSICVMQLSGRTRFTTDKGRGGYGLAVGIHRKSGIVYMFGAQYIGIDNVNYIKIARFKSVIEAISFGKELMRLHSRNDSVEFDPTVINEIDNECVRELFIGGHSRITNINASMLIIRQKVMEGMTDEYPMVYDYIQKLFDMVVKQPKK